LHLLDAILFYRKYEKEIENLISYPTGEDLKDVTWKSLIANTIIYNDRTYSQLEKETAALSWRKFLTKLAEASSDLDDCRYAAKPYIYQLLLMRQCSCFCISENGYVGWATKNAQVGDLIFVPFGSKVPFIIRKSDERPGCFRLIGQSYIHGIMNGELLEPGSFQSEEINLH
jgi:hypothetical protein